MLRHGVLYMNKDEKLGITKDKLLRAAMSLMEETDDPLSVTSRQIADRAGVKASMINYCFGSREELLHKTFEKEYLHFLDKENVKGIVDSDMTPKDKLKKLHFIVSKCLIENYNFTKVITSFVLFRRDLSEPSFSSGLVSMHYKGRKTDEECRLIAYELSTMMQLMIYRKDEIKKGFGIDLDDDEVLRNVISMRVDLLLGGE